MAAGLYYRLTPHAREEAIRRSIPTDIIDSVMREPQQVLEAFGGKRAYQSKIRFEGDKMYLVRLIVDERTAPSSVVTVYRTSKVKKYWREKQ